LWTSSSIIPITPPEKFSLLDNRQMGDLLYPDIRNTMRYKLAVGKKYFIVDS